jgi:hypothetical protein
MGKRPLNHFSNIEEAKVLITRFCGLAFALLAVFWIATTVFGETPPPQDILTFLRRQLAVTPLEIASLEKGQIIVRLPKTPETREVATMAIMRLNVPEDFFIAQVRDIVNFKSSENVVQIGKFSDPPKLADLSDLVLDAADIESVRRCRLNSCDMKVSAGFIERFRREIDWSAPNYRERTSEVVRELMLERVNSYLHEGDTALGEYRDKSYRLKLADEFQSLLQPTPYMFGYVPEFQKYLIDYPQSRPAGVEDFFYWSKEIFGLKPVISLTHVVIYKRFNNNGTDLLIASKGIYANHYMETSLGLTGFIHAAGRTYLIYTNRSRADALRGLFAGLKRSLIASSLRDGTRKNMEMIKKKLESKYWQ